MNGFVYKWTNIINGMWYIGSRKGTINDGYIGSGEYFLRAVKKYGIENFTREILFEGDHEKDKIRSVKEAKFLNTEDAANNPMSYNQTNITGPNCFGEEARRNMSRGQKGRIHSEEHIRKRKEATTGMTRSEATKEKMKDNTNGKGNKGRIHSEIHRQRNSESKKGVKRGADPRIACPNCDVVGGSRAMKRWHLDNCKELS